MVRDDSGEDCFPVCLMGFNAPPLVETVHVGKAAEQSAVRERPLDDQLLFGGQRPAVLNPFAVKKLPERKWEGFPGYAPAGKGDDGLLAW